MSHRMRDVQYYTVKSYVSYEKHMEYGFPHIFIETRLVFRCLVNWENDTAHTWIKPSCAADALSTTVYLMSMCRAVTQSQTVLYFNN